MLDLFKSNLSAQGVIWNGFVKGTCLIATILIDLFYTKFLVYRLGTESYSLIPLTSNIVQFSSIITYAILSATGRYVSLEIHKGNRETANEYFNVSFYVLLIFSISVLFPVFAVISWFSPDIFVVPKGLENVSRILFSIVFFSFILVSIGSMLAIGSFVYNRLDLIDLQNLFKIIISRFIAIGLIYYVGLQLYGVCIGLFIGTMAGFILSWVYWRNIDLGFSISKKFWNFEKYQKIKSFLSWVLLRQIGGRALVYLDLIIVNRLFGAVYTGWYGLAFFFPSRIRFLAGTFSGLVSPILIKYYAANDIEGMLNTANRAIRMIGIIFALPVGLICGFYKSIFLLWIGKSYIWLFNLAVILTIHVSLNTSSYILSAVLSAINKVKIPSLMSIFFALVNIPLAIALGHPNLLNMGMVGVALSSLLTLTINNSVFTPYYIGVALSRSPMSIYRSFLPGIFGVGFVFILSFWLGYLSIALHFLGLIMLMLVISLLYLPLSWFCLLQTSDRVWIRTFALNKLRSLRREYLK